MGDWSMSNSFPQTPVRSLNSSGTYLEKKIRFKKYEDDRSAVFLSHFDHGQICEEDRCQPRVDDQERQWILECSTGRGNRGDQLACPAPSDGSSSMDLKGYREEDD